MNLNELIDQIYESLQISSDDTSVDRRLIEAFINEERALWIRREHNKNRSIDDNLIQDLGCVELELVEPTSPDCCDLDLGECKILRSVLKLPNAIELNHDKMITRIGYINMTTKPWTLLDLDAVPYFGHGRFNSTQIAGFLRSNYLYLFSRDESKMRTLEIANVMGVWETPRDVSNFRTCEDAPCWTSEDPYPINTWMWSEFIKPRVLEKLAPKIAYPKDESGNAQDNRPPQNLPQND